MSSGNFWHIYNIGKPTDVDETKVIVRMEEVYWKYKILPKTV